MGTHQHSKGHWQSAFLHQKQPLKTRINSCLEYLDLWNVLNQLYTQQFCQSLQRHRHSRTNPNQQAFNFCSRLSLRTHSETMVNSSTTSWNGGLEKDRIFSLAVHSFSWRYVSDVVNKRLSLFLSICTTCSFALFVPVTPRKLNDLVFVSIVTMPRR